MKKILSIFLAVLMTFGSVAIGITAAPHTHAEESQQTYTEGNFVYEIADNYAIIVDYTDKESTDEIVIPDTLGGHSVNELAAEAFKGCRCEAVMIPASVTDINVEAFAYDMPNLERYTVDADNLQYSSENGIIYSARSSGTYKTLFAYPKNAPEESLDLSVIEIAPFAFTGVQNLKSISLTSHTTRMYYDIDKFAFYNATSLENVAMEAYINSIGDYAFASCPSLESVSISDVVENLGWEIFADTPLINNSKNFDNDGVLYLGDNLIATHPFGDIKENYEIAAGTEAIAGGAFQWNSLKKVYLPASVEHIQSNPFAKCPNLETFTFHSEGIFKVDEYGVLFSSKKLIAYPNGIYLSCYSVEDAVNRHTIVPYAFYLSPVKNIYIPSSSYSYKHIGYCGLGGEGVTDIHFEGDKSSWDSMRYIKEPYETMIAAEDVATIHFNSYSSSEHTVISNNGIQSVCSCGYTVEHSPANGDCTEDGFVYDIISKKAIITDYKFKESTAALVIPESINGYPVTKLDRGAFKDCMFTSVQIPSGVTEIDPEAFAYALNNQSFTVAAGNRSFKAIDGVLFNSSSAIVAYPQNAPATEYKQPYGAFEILPYAFFLSKNLKTLNLWQGVTVKDYAFVNSSVEEIINTDIKQLGSGAFKNSELKEFSITSTPEFFGYNVFEGTPFLENAVYDEDGVFYHENILIATKKESDKNYYEIKAGTTVIAGGAFIWKSLEEVYIPESVKTLNGSSFSHATSLKTFTVDSNNLYFATLDFSVLYNRSKTKLVACSPAIENICYCIPRGVTEIGAFAFNNVQLLRYLNIPTTVTTVYEYAFGACGFEGLSRICYEGTEISWNKINFIDSGSDMVSFERFIPKTFETYDSVSHDIAKTETYEADCTSNGYIKYTCVCGAWCTQTTQAAFGHTPEDEYTVRYKPTCERSGEERLYCSVCSGTIDTRYPSPLGHDKQLIEHRKPTCETIGENVYKCNRCNKEIIEAAEPALGHISSGETVKIEPTCTEDGGLYNLCDRCSEPIYDECIEVYPATGHTEGEWKRTQEPTCTYQQVDTLFCSVCAQAIETKIGDYGDHIYREELDYQDCTYKCILVYCIGGCKYEKYEETVAPDDAILGEDESGLGHVVELVTEEATCRHGARTYYRCIVCEEVVGEITYTSEALEHNWVEESYWEPDCWEEGYIYYRCSLCKRGKYVDLPMIPHNFEEWKYENGNLFSGECTYCGEIFESIEVELTLDSTELTLENQSSKTLAVTFTEHITDDIVFTSSDSNIASVDADGTITAKAPGNAVITAKINGTEITAQCEVTVKARSFRVDWVVNGEIYDYSFIEEGSNIEAPEDPEKAGYIFAGWSPAIPDEMPAMPLQFTAVFNKFSKSEDYDVSATFLPEAFSEEVSLNVTEITADREPGGVYMVEGEYYKQIGLYNIKALNAASAVVQPNEGYTVTIKMAIPDANKNRTDIMIYHS